MSRRCREIEGWLGRPFEALSSAEGLALAQHLTGCVECRALHEMSRSLGELVVHTGSTELPSASRERAIGRAFERAAEPRVPPRSVWRARSLGLAVAAVAAVVLLVQMFMRTPAEPVAWLEQDGTYGLAHAQVTLLDHGRARFDAQEMTLELSRGAVEVDVDPRPRRPFAVRTEYFRVEVLGTQFYVDRDSVAVTRGHVRVVAHQGGRVLADLRAGQRYDRKTIATQPSPAPRALEVVEVPSEGVTKPREPRVPAVVRAKPIASREPKNEAPQPSAKGLLNDARAALGRDDLTQAHSLLAQAEQVAQARVDRAEAGTLRAELALRERDLTRAIAAYLAVADAYPELPSGENALFAAAQLAMRAKRGDARDVMSRYLQRYPRGRFVEEARARLAAP